MYKNLKKQDKILRDKYYLTLEMLSIDPFYPSLSLHKLSGVLEGCYSISIEMKRRILIDFIIKDGIIILLDVGDHGIYKNVNQNN